MMLQGVKKEEFRKPSDWIKSRLVGKQYKFVKFVNGYGNDKPYFICEYKGYRQTEKTQTIVFNKEKVEVNSGDYIIDLGKIVDCGNLDTYGQNKPFCK